MGDEGRSDTVRKVFAIPSVSRIVWLVNTPGMRASAAEAAQQLPRSVRDLFLLRQKPTLAVHSAARMMGCNNLVKNAFRIGFPSFLRSSFSRAIEAFASDACIMWAKFFSTRARNPHVVQHAASGQQVGMQCTRCGVCRGGDTVSLAYHGTPQPCAPRSRELHPVTACWGEHNSTVTPRKW